MGEICLCRVSMLETNSAASARPRGVVVVVVVVEKQTNLQTRRRNWCVSGFWQQNKLGNL